MQKQASPRGEVTLATWLENEFTERRRRNPRYSLRSFARYLGISSGRLSELMSGKRRLSLASTERISARLELKSDQRARFAALALGIAQPTAPRKRTLPADEFDVIADWYHFAILSLLRTEPPPCTPREIANRLGISVSEARASVARLQRLSLIARTKDGWVLTGEDLRTDPATSKAALRRSHRQSLEQAIEALEEVPSELRSITSVTLALNPDKLSLARQMIAHFESAMEQTLEVSPRRKVYNLNIQLVPVEKWVDRQ